jgi:hypothetical protein
MESALLLLLNLAPIVAPLRGHGTLPALVPPASLLSRMLGEYVPAAQAEEIITFLDELTQEAIPIDSAMRQIRQFAEQIAEGAANAPDRAASLEVAAQQIGLLASLNRHPADGNSPLRHLRTSLDNSLLSPIVQEWHIHTAQGGQDIVVISRVHARTEQIFFRPRGSHYIERRIVLHYNHDDDHPVIELNTLTATMLDRHPRARHLWRQPATPDYDLIIYTEQERLKGRIMTRFLELPLVLEGDTITLTASLTAGGRIAATDVLDEQDQPLLRVLCWPPVSQHSAAG